MFSMGQGVKSGSNCWNPLHLWPVIFANACSLVLLPWLLWRRVRLYRDWPTLVVCGIFTILQLLNNLAWGIYDENRDWLELAPIGWILIAEQLLSKPPKPGANPKSASEMAVAP
jgi:hypothetical protein